jgi:hypothetical protein
VKHEVGKWNESGRHSLDSLKQLLQKVSDNVSPEHFENW